MAAKVFNIIKYAIKCKKCIISNCEANKQSEQYLIDEILLFLSILNFRIGVTFVEASFVGLCYKNVLMMPVQRALNHTAGLTLPESGILP
jgi:hypothetical protein